MAEIDWPWQYNFPPFYTIQPHADTRSKQLIAWRSMILDYYKTTRQTVLDISEAQRSPLFYNASINRKLPSEGILAVLEYMVKSGNAAPVDKTKNRWEIYWHSLEEWGNMVYAWASDNGMNNTVCTLYELTQGENTIDQEFYGLDTNVLTKALRTLEMNNKCELLDFDDSQGVKFL